jgi:hypothetical protein
MSFGTSFQDKILMEQTNLATKKLEELNYLTDFISKQKVREAIDNVLKYLAVETTGEFRKGVVVGLIQIKKELGLDDEVRK